MPLIKCHECKHEISSEAPACPRCGAPARRGTSRVTWIIGLLLVAGVASNITGPGTSTPAAAPTKSPEQLAAEAKHAAAFNKTVVIARQFKQALRDPDSVTWDTIRANEDASLVCIEYRARNGFGGMNKEFVVVRGAKVSQRPADWNRHCTAPLTDFRHARRSI